MRRHIRHWSFLGMLAALFLVLSPVGVRAQVELAAAGSGGTAECAGNGGAVAAGDVNAGANAGSAIGIGETWGDVAVDGGAMANSTDFGVAGEGGISSCDASGGTANDAFLIDRIVVPAPAPDPPAPDPPAPDAPPVLTGDVFSVEFEICVQVDDAGTPVCNPGLCNGPATAAECTVVAGCPTIDPSLTDPCSFANCTVSGGPVSDRQFRFVGFCLIVP